MEKIKITFNNTNLAFSFQDKTTNVKLKQNALKADLNEAIKLQVMPVKHSQLEGLDFESSGHIGFASENQLNLLKSEVAKNTLELNDKILTLDNTKVSKRLENTPILTVKNSKNQYIFVDNNGTDSKISIRDINNRLLRTVDEIPSDMEEGEYILLKI